MDGKRDSHTTRERRWPFFLASSLPDCGRGWSGAIAAKRQTLTCRSAWLFATCCDAAPFFVPLLPLSPSPVFLLLPAFLPSRLPALLPPCLFFSSSFLLCILDVFPPKWQRLQPTSNLPLPLRPLKAILPLHEVERRGGEGRSNGRRGDDARSTETHTSSPPPHHTHTYTHTHSHTHTHAAAYLAPLCYRPSSLPSFLSCHLISC